MVAYLTGQPLLEQFPLRKFLETRFGLVWLDICGFVHHVTCVPRDVRSGLESTTDVTICSEIGCGCQEDDALYVLIDERPLIDLRSNMPSNVDCKHRPRPLPCRAVIHQFPIESAHVASWFWLQFVL